MHSQPSKRHPRFAAAFALCMVMGRQLSAQADRRLETRAAQPLAAAVTAMGSSSITGVPDQYALDATSGNKLAVGLGRLHLVYVDGGAVKYTSTTDAQAWSPPVELAPNAVSPSIAASGGVVGVVYVVGWTIYYRYRTSAAGPWSAPTVVSTHGSWGATTSLAAYGNRMYLAWTINGQGEVQVGDFPATAPVALPLQFATQILLCLGTTSAASNPSIAVGPWSATNPQPRVRVAFFYTGTVTNPPCGQPGTTYGLSVLERGPNGWFYRSGYSGIVPTVPIDGPISLSMIADAAGDFLLAFSAVLNGIGIVQLERSPGNVPANQPIQPSVVPITYSVAHVHLAPISMPCSGFRLTVSNEATGLATYADSWYRDGTWAAGAAPAWSSPAVPFSTLGRSAQSIQWTRHFGSPLGGYTRRLIAVYGALAGSSQHQVHAAYRDVPGMEAACMVRGTIGHPLPL